MTVTSKTMRFEPVLIVAHDLAVILLLPPVDVSGLGGQPNQAQGVIRIRVYRRLDLYRLYFLFHFESIQKKREKIRKYLGIRGKTGNFQGCNWIQNGIKIFLTTNFYMFEKLKFKISCR